MIKRWKISDKIPKEVMAKLDLHPLVAQILWNREVLGFDEPADSAMRFLNPSYERDLRDPFLLSGMKEAVKKIEKHIHEKSKICIYGDFDVDGVCGASVLYETLKLIGADVFVYIPERDKEGYGVNRDAVKKVLEQGTNLIITVDCGITGKQELELAQLTKCDCIVVDHHEPQEEKLPKAIIVNPKMKGDKYPQKDLCATALAWKLSFALSTHYPLLTTNYLKWLLDLVGLATICDVIPLVGENRVLAFYGLKVLRLTKRIGLQELYKIALIKPETIGSYDVGFQIGPRLNAPGRIGSASLSFKLLTTKDEKEACELAQKTNEYNLERQRILEEALKEAKTEVETKKLHEKKIILLGRDSWIGGIVGLVAGKLSQMFYRPALVFERGPQVSKGSARSIDGFHLVDNLYQCKEFLTKFGGHSKAAGFSFMNENEEKLYSKLLKLAEQELTDEDLIPEISIDAEANLDEFNLDLWDNNLLKLEPFGFGNPRPTFLLKNLSIMEKRLMGKDEKHAKFWVKDEQGKFANIVGFDWGEQAREIEPGEVVDAVVNADANEWNGERRLEFRLIDLKQI